MPNKTINVLLCFTLFTVFVRAQNGPQPCPENPIVLTGSDFGQFVYSPYNEHNKYPPNTDCRFILVARTLQRRIHITVIESQLEEPLFIDCKDFVSIRDGALPTSQEILRWCGSFYPPSLTSSGDSLYIHFHSDNIIQSRGFNLSFVDYDIPGCPNDWISDMDGKYCYKLFGKDREYTFMDAQKVCFYERSNLLTLEDQDEYNFITSQYTGRLIYPWIGYNDANKEGIFDPIDPNIKTWPEDFPDSKSEHNDKDCVYLNWNDASSKLAHTIEDCRNKHSLICKKRQDGTTVPIQLSSTLVRYGLKNASFNYTILLIVLLVLLILLILLWLIYQKCKRRNTIEAVNHSQRTPITSETGRRDTSTKTTKISKAETTRATSNSAVSAAKNKTSSTDAVKRIIDSNSQRKSSATETALQQAISEEDNNEEQNHTGNRRNSDHAYNGENSPRIRTRPNQPMPDDIDLQSSHDSRVQTDARAQIENASRIEHSEVQERDENALHEEPDTPRPADRSHLYVENDEEPIRIVSKPPPKTNNGSPPTQINAVLPPVGEPNIHREPEPTNATGFSSTRSRVTHPSSQTFERPHVGTLDNISAISLDEFWQKN